MQFNEAGECVFAPSHAPMCKPHDKLDACMCSPELKRFEAYEPKCHPQYSMTEDCMCEGNPECMIAPTECVEGQYFDIWACGCLDWPVCDAQCEKGFVHHKLTCECV